jgi:4-amino-4-deoxy-L-arabinose transferase-like glycosyltransferase
VRARPTTTRGKFVLFVGLWAVLGYAVVSASMTKFHHYILPAVPAIAILCGWFLDELLSGEIPAATATTALVLFGLPMLAMVTWDLTQSIQAPQRLLWLFDYDYINNPRGRTWPEQLDYRFWILGFAIAAAIGTALVSWPKIRRYAAVGLCAVAIGFTYFALDRMLIQLSPHWSQKHLLQTYYKLKQPGDRIVAWQMYWRGETFYTENELFDPKLPREEKSVFCFERNVENLQEWLKKHQGVHTYFVIEKARVESLRSLMPYPQGKQTLKVVDDTNNKFVLAVATI